MAGGGGWRANGGGLPVPEEAVELVAEADEELREVVDREGRGPGGQGGQPEEAEEDAVRGPAPHRASGAPGPPVGAGGG